MQTRVLAGVALLLLALLLAGCGGDVVADLYVQDLVDVVTGEEGMVLTTATIFLESPGEEYNEQLMDLVAANFRDAKNFRTMSSDYSTQIAVDVRVPVMHLDDSGDFWFSEDALSIMVFEFEDGIGAFGLALNSDKLDELFSSMAEETWFSFGISDFDFTVKLINDLREPVVVYMQGVYANQVPLAYEEAFVMDRRDTIDLRLGDVARDYAYEEGFVVLGVLVPAE